MSSPGPDIVVACPYCKAPARRPTFRSLSLMGQAEWSDGFVLSLPSTSTPVAQCSGCRRAYWVDSATIIDEATTPFDLDERNRLIRNWGHVAYVDQPTEAEYYAAIARGDLTSTPEREREARLRAWWRRNDSFRSQADGRGGHIAWADEGRSNLEILIRMLSEAGEHRLLQAEGYRELGRLERAAETLETVDSAEDRETKRRLLEFCAAGDTQVQLIASTTV